MGLFDNNPGPFSSRRQLHAKSPDPRDELDQQSFRQHHERILQASQNLSDHAIQLPGSVISLLSVMLEAARDFKPVGNLQLRGMEMPKYLWPGDPFRFLPEKNPQFGISVGADVDVYLAAVSPNNSRAGAEKNAAQAKSCIDGDWAELKIKNNSVGPKLLAPYAMDVLIDLRQGVVNSVCIYEGRSAFFAFTHANVMPESWLAEVIKKIDPQRVLEQGVYG